MASAGRRIRAGAAATVFVALAVVLAATGCSSSTAEEHVVTGSASDRWPSGTFPDWVSYADHLAVIKILREHENPLSAEEAAAGEGYADREVDAQVERILWSRQGAAEIRRVFTYHALGWVVQDGKRYPAGTVDGVRVEVGERYLVPLVPFRGSWVPLSSTATMPLDGDVVEGTGRERPKRIYPAERMIGETADEVAAVLTETRPDPAVVKHWDLPPEQRIDAVLRDRAT
jgi:hypothetical protein